MLKPIFIKILFFTRLTSNTLSLFIRQGSWLRCGNQILFPSCHIWLVLYFFWVTPLEQWGLWAIVVSIALSEHQSGGTLLGRLVSKGHVLGKQLHVSQWSFVLWLFFPHFAQCLSYFFVIENLFIVDDDDVPRAQLRCWNANDAISQRKPSRLWGCDQGMRGGPWVCVRKVKWAVQAKREMCSAKL